MNKNDILNSTQTKYEYPDDPTFTKFLDNWYFYQTYSSKIKDVSVFKIIYKPL